MYKQQKNTSPNLGWWTVQKKRVNLQTQDGTSEHSKCRAKSVRHQTKQKAKNQKAKKLNQIKSIFSKRS